MAGPILQYTQQNGDPATFATRAVYYAFPDTSDDTMPGTWIASDDGMIYALESTASIAADIASSDPGITVIQGTMTLLDGRPFRWFGGYKQAAYEVRISAVPAIDRIVIPPPSISDVVVTAASLTEIGLAIFFDVTAGIVVSIQADAPLSVDETDPSSPTISIIAGVEGTLLTSRPNDAEQTQFRETDWARESSAATTALGGTPIVVATVVVNPENLQGGVLMIAYQASIALGTAVVGTNGADLFIRRNGAEVVFSRIGFLRRYTPPAESTVDDKSQLSGSIILEAPSFGPQTIQLMAVKTGTISTATLTGQQSLGVTVIPGAINAP